MNDEFWQDGWVLDRDKVGAFFKEVVEGLIEEFPGLVVDWTCFSSTPAVTLNPGATLEDLIFVSIGYHEWPIEKLLEGLNEDDEEEVDEDELERWSFSIIGPKDKIKESASLMHLIRTVQGNFEDFEVSGGLDSSGDFSTGEDRQVVFLFADEYGITKEFLFDPLKEALKKKGVSKKK